MAGDKSWLMTPVPLPALEAPGQSKGFRALWPRTIDWVRPYYDSIHLFHTGRWLLTLDPDSSESHLIAAITHDMERHFPGGTQPDKAGGAWADVEYNTLHCRRSAGIVAGWLREQGIEESFVHEVEIPILEHEFGGCPAGDLLQAADSLSFLEVNSGLVSRWVLDGETSLEIALEKLNWMCERIKLKHARTFALPLYQQALEAVRAEVARASAPA